jgi:hypothetical protein
MTNLVFFLALSLVVFSQSLKAQDLSKGTGLQASISVDMVGEFKLDKDSTATDRFDIREAEATFFAPIDHIFDGSLSMAAHKEDGVSIFELHEAVISTVKLIPRSRIRMGQFFLGIGRLNQVHRHDWPFISAPKVQTAFFDEEAVMDSGAEYSFLLPIPFFLELTAGVTNGWVYGHAHDEGEKPRTPTTYGRILTYTDLPSNGGVQVGLNGLSRKSSNKETMVLFGADVTAKWSEAKYVSFLLQSEIWKRKLTPPEGEPEEALGAYIYPQYAFSSRLNAGVRFDYYTITSLENAIGEKVSNSDTAIVPTMTFKPSEFSTLRAAYNRLTSKLENTDDKVNQTFEIQTVFILGAHPAHAF